MALDINALFDDPRFQSGLGMIGAASPRHRGLLNAYEIMQLQKKQLAEEEYRRAQAHQAEERSKLYKQQVEQQTRRNALMERYGDEARDIYRQILAGEQAPAQPQAQPAVAPDTVNARPLPRMELTGGTRITPQSQAALDADRPVILASELEDANRRLAAGDLRAQGDITAITNDIQRLPAISSTLSGSPEQQTKQRAQSQSQIQRRTALEQALKKSLALQAAGGMMNIEKPGEGLLGLSKSVLDAQKARSDLEKLEIQEQELQLKQAENVRQEQELGLRKQAATQIQQEKTLKAAEIKAKDRAAFDTVHSSSVAAERLTNELLKNPSFDQIFGRTGGLISPRLLSGEAMNAAASLETLKAKMLNDTLQAIRQSSANGASGYGQLDKTEGENLRQLVATLERAQTPEHARKSLQEIQKHLRKVSNRSQDVYEETYKEGAFKGKPVGTRIKRFGTLNGRTVIEYSSGETEYAD